MYRRIRAICYAIIIYDLLCLVLPNIYFFSTFFNNIELWDINHHKFQTSPPKKSRKVSYDPSEDTGGDTPGDTPDGAPEGEMPASAPGGSRYAPEGGAPVADIPDSWTAVRK